MAEDTFEVVGRNFNNLSRDLHAASQDIVQVLDLAAEARSLPLNDIIPFESKDAQRGLTQLRHMRSSFIGRLVVFRDVLMPVSTDTVVGLSTFINYMEDEEGFLTLAKEGEVSLLCSEYAEQSKVVQAGFEALATDLEVMAAALEDDLKKVRLDIEVLCQKQLRKDAVNKKLAQASIGCLSGGLVAGAVLALGLLGPGGLLFAPALAVPAFTGCVAGGTTAALVAQKAADDGKEKAAATKEVTRTLSSAHQAAKDNLPFAVVRFSAAMGCLAGFFGCLNAEIQKIERQASRIESVIQQDDYRDAQYKALYKVLYRQMAKVQESCMQYISFASVVNIKVNTLQINEEMPVLSYIEQWFQEQTKEDQKSAAGSGHMTLLHSCWSSRRNKAPKAAVQRPSVTMMIG